MENGKDVLQSLQLDVPSFFLAFRIGNQKGIPRPSSTACNRIVRFDKDLDMDNSSKLYHAMDKNKLKPSSI